MRSGVCSGPRGGRRLSGHQRSSVRPLLEPCSVRLRHTRSRPPYPGAVSARYGTDVLSGDWCAPRGGRAVPTEAERGLVVEDVQTGYVGAVVHVEKAGGMQVVHLEDRNGRRRGFPLGPGFLLEGRPVVLTVPTAATEQALAQARAKASRTASGSRSVAHSPARVAAGSRIFVEGRHDAELVEKIWGDDLRVEGVRSEERRVGEGCRRRA